MWDTYITVSSIEEAISYLSQNPNNCKIIAGGTDLILEIKHELHKQIHTLIDLSRIKNITDIWQDKEGFIHINPGATHNHCLNSDLIKQNAIALYQACLSIGAPQIRNIGTVYGNLITASPANDTISALIALDAEITLQSSHGKRSILLEDFYLGVRKTAIHVNEVAVDLKFASNHANTRSCFEKSMLRNAHGISVANCAVSLKNISGIVKDVRIVLGSVGPKVFRAKVAETEMEGRSIKSIEREEILRLAIEQSTPINDIRSSQDYRKQLIKVLLNKCLQNLLEEKQEKLIEPAVLLWGSNKFNPSEITETVVHTREKPIQTSINDKDFVFQNGQTDTLLHLIREEAKFTGTKSGCEEGECGACTLYLDRVPVLSCLVPAPRAHLAKVTTIENMSEGTKLNAIQKAFVEEGAVQCGYCTPGFVMSATKLLEEVPHPNRNQIKVALAGNICRCTGYQKIIRAVEKAAEDMGA